LKQLLQNLKTGEMVLEEVPCPSLKPGHVLIRTVRSLISTGTEKMLLDFGKANLLDKARQQPDKVRLVLDKIKTDGLLPTLEAVQNKLDQPLPMGYCNVGVVIEAASDVSEFHAGDRVASNGKHAEVVAIPKHLCAKIPDTVGDDQAAFTVLGAIALQGIRLAQPTLGESVVVTGLGLIGLLTAQLLRAQGCRVLGIDLDSRKLELAAKFGAGVVNPNSSNPVEAALSLSRGRGVDAVLIAAATKSSEPVHQAALMCRKRGRIVLIGVTGLELSRADFYEKELTFQVSCSYGPGRYDSSYEERGQDYPVGFVRWTVQRNFEAVLDTMAGRGIVTDVFISHRFPFEQSKAAYELITGDTPSLGVLLTYDTTTARALEHRRSTIKTIMEESPVRSDIPAAAFIGSGNYATQVLIPAFKQTGIVLKTIACSSGVSGTHAAKKFGFAETTTDIHRIFSDPAVNTVVIATRHDSHAAFICQALSAGKHVFVEKPLAITREQLQEIESVYQRDNRAVPSGVPLENMTDRSAPLLMVGFNRRFAPHIQKIKELLAALHEPKTFIMTVNAGEIPFSHWTQDRRIGGGRIVGEGCHFIDLLRYLADSPIATTGATMIGPGSGATIRDDKVSIMLTFADGSFGTIHYLSNGHKSFPKERLEVFCAGRILQLDNFRRLHGFGWPGFKKMNLWRQDKGQKACAAAFVSAIRQGQPPSIPFQQLLEVTRATFDIMDCLE
jgi:predicted dehydrogenase